MGKQVVVIASGVTEQRSLPHLLAHLRAEDIAVVEVRIPPRHKALNVDMAEKLLKAIWFEKLAEPPDKFVVLVDTDGKAPDDVLRPFREKLPNRISASVKAQLQFAYAQWHLEAWYFADISGLGAYLGRQQFSVDTSKPDEIQNPKNHLRNILGVYTAVISEEIASSLDPRLVSQRSPSFRTFIDAVRNGNVMSSA